MRGKVAKRLRAQTAAMLGTKTTKQTEYRTPVYMNMPRDKFGHIDWPKYVELIDKIEDPKLKDFSGVTFARVQKGVPAVNQGFKAEYKVAKRNYAMGCV